MSPVQCGPKVSVVIPTRGRSELLRRAVSSVFRQTMEDFEVLVVIDGPDPQTQQDLADIHDPRLRVIALASSVGGSDARNAGAAAARGRWIALLDDDDEWLPEKLASQLRLAEKDGGRRALVVSQFIARSKTRGDAIRPERFPRPGERMSEYMFSPKCGFQTSTFFCSRDLFLEIPFTTGLTGCQDLDWFLRVTSAASVELLVVPTPQAIFHIPDARPSVSRGLDWRYRLDWGKSRRQLMGGRAYSLFIPSVCATKAAADGHIRKSAACLLRECIFSGNPDLRIVGRLLGVLLVSPRMRDVLQRLKFRPAQRVRTAIQKTV